MSETSQTSSSGTGGPSGNSIAGPSGSGPDVGRNAAIASGPGVATAAALAALSYMWGVDIGSGGILTPAAIIGSIIDGLVQLFLDIFGGSDTPPIPRQLLHARHPLYPDILGVSDDLIPDEVSLGKPQFCGDPHVCNHCPVQRVEDSAPGPQQNQQKQQKQSVTDCLINAATTQLVILPIVCGPSALACLQVEAPGINIPACRIALGTCIPTLAVVAACIAGKPLPEF